MLLSRLTSSKTHAEHFVDEVCATENWTSAWVCVGYTGRRKRRQILLSAWVRSAHDSLRASSFKTEAITIVTTTANYSINSLNTISEFSSAAVLEASFTLCGVNSQQNNSPLTTLRGFVSKPAPSQSDHNAIRHAILLAGEQRARHTDAGVTF
jgi:hypothetical protein